jgi:hypothetical protein
MGNRVIFHSRVGTFLLAILSVCLLVWLSYRALRMAFADSLFRQNTIASVQRAIRWEPDNASYYTWLASLQEFAGQDPNNALLASVKLNPWDSSTWIRLAEHAEAREDQVPAERYLLRAAMIDQQFSPRWALMNFYFRQGRQEPFWLWTTKALAMSYGDLAPVFDLCWKMTTDASVIRRAIPSRPVLLAQYLAYLMATGRLQVADQVAQDLSSQATESERPVLLTFCDRSIAAGHAASALAVWNAMCERKLLPFAPLHPEAGVSLTNGDFALPFSSQGFDWNVTKAPEIELSSVPGGVAFTLSGDQPPDSELAIQYVPVLPRTRYNLHFQYRVGAASMRGVGWTVTPASPETPFQELTSGIDEWRDGNYPFGPVDVALCRLILKAVRIPGNTRPEGRFSLRHVRLELIP